MTGTIWLDGSTGGVWRSVRARAHNLGQACFIVVRISEAQWCTGAIQMSRTFQQVQEGSKPYGRD